MRIIFCALLLSAFSSVQSLAAPRVITDIAPVHGLVSRVMTGVGSPSLIVPPGVSAHYFSLSPSNTKTLSQANVVFWVGSSLTPWLQKPIENIARNAESVALLPLSGELLLPVQATHSHGHSHQHFDSHKQFDPHAWLDPEIASRWLNIIAETLATLDPRNASDYRVNAKAGQAEIERTFAVLSDKLSTIKTKPFAAYHDAYQYLERRFELKFIGSLKNSDAAPLSARRLAELRETLSEYPEVCVLTEPQYPPQLVEVLSNKGNVRLGIIDPLGSNIPNGPNFYTQLLDEIGHNLISCF